MGILFLLFGFAVGPDYEYFYAYPLLSVICIARAFHIYQQRRKFSRRNRMTVLTETQKIERDTPQEKAPE
jgi:hypothetical protein